jgi:hypothetical protein
MLLGLVLVLERSYSYLRLIVQGKEIHMITNSPAGLLIFTEALAKTLIHKGVFERSELIDQLENMRNDKDRVPADQAAVAAEIDIMITRVDRL